ncbi:VOC family protein [Streptomyces sp. NPDC055287]
MSRDSESCRSSAKSLVGEVRPQRQRCRVSRGRAESWTVVGIRLGSTVINCADIDVMTRFWCEALGLEPSSTEPGDHFRLLRGDRGNVSLQRTLTPVTARDQMHPDLYSDDQQAQVDRFVGLGARLVRHVTDDPDDDYVILADPEDNLFCVRAKRASQVHGR